MHRHLVTYINISQDFMLSMQDKLQKVDGHLAHQLFIHSRAYE